MNSSRRTIASLLALACITLPGLARAQLTDHGTQPGTLQTPLAPESQCSECHSGLQTAAGENYMAADLWPASLKANAVRDPLFLATLTVAEQDHAGLGTYCIRCHSPAAFTNGHATPGFGTALDPFTDQDGVHCDTCHRSLDPAIADPTSPFGNGALFFDDAPPAMLVTRHGPRDDPFMSTRHLSIGDEFIQSSRMCGQCHDVENPLVHRRAADGTDTGMPFPLQSTYTEFAQSDFARRASPQECQDCHMPAESEALQYARTPGSPTRTDSNLHTFVGGNELAIGMLRQAFAGERDSEFDAQRLREQAFLRTSATLEITSAPSDGMAGTNAHVTVRVTNLTGHKLPTGYEDARVMWLEVSVGDRVVSGAFASDALVEDPQVRVYRFRPGVWAPGGGSADDHAAHHDTVIEDTRIPPLGMMPNARTMPVGRDYSGAAGGALRNDDTTSYDVPLPATNGPSAVRVRLLYQLTTSEYVSTITAANHTDDRGTRLTDLWTASGRGAPFSLAEATAMVTVHGGTDPDAGSADASSDATGAPDAGTDVAVVPDANTDAPTDTGIDGGTTGMHAGCGCRAIDRTRPSPASAAVTALIAALAIARRRRSSR